MKTDVKTLEAVAAKSRLLGLDMVYNCASGHIGGSFSAMDVLTVLYFDVMNIDPARRTTPTGTASSSPRVTAPPPSIPPWPSGATSPRKT